MVKDTNALGAEKRTTELRITLEHRRRYPLTPYKAEFWDKLLQLHNLHKKYLRLVTSLQKGFNTGIQ
jgi:hypothetical protein